MAGSARHTLDSAARTLTVADLIALFDAGELWRPLPGFPYEVSSHGRVRRQGRKVPLRAGNKDGYRIACLCRNGIKTMARINRLVAFVFWGSPFDGAEALHFDGDPANNRVSNVRWGTALENHRDQVRHGTRLRGSKMAGAKLTEADIPELDRLVTATSYRKAGSQFGVTAGAVHAAVHRKNWKHVPRERVAA